MLSPRCYGCGRCHGGHKRCPCCGRCKYCANHMPLRWWERLLRPFGYKIVGF